MADAYAELIELYALGLLDEEERERLERHLDQPCAECRRALADSHELLAELPALEGAQAAPADLREHLLELAGAPRGPLRLQDYTWDEVLPGVRMHVLREDAARNLRVALVWAAPGARYPPHRHLGDEEILVLQGRLRDHRAVYEPGQVCRSRTGSVHSEEVVSDEDCVCYVVYHGEHEMVGEA